MASFRNNFQGLRWLSQQLLESRRLSESSCFPFEFNLRHLNIQISSADFCKHSVLGRSSIFLPSLWCKSSAHTVTPHTPRFVSRHLHASAEHFPHSAEWTVFTEHISCWRNKKKGKYISCGTKIVHVRKSMCIGIFSPGYNGYALYNSIEH